MDMPLSLLERTRIEKAAQDAGFDLASSVEDGWLLLRSSLFSHKVGVSSNAHGRYVVAIPVQSVISQIANEYSLEQALGGSTGSSVVTDIDGFEQLYDVLDRAASMLRVMNGAGLQHFQERTRTPPDATEVSRMVQQRVGQDVFRATLLEYWGGRCAISGLDELQLLRASHIKPWAKCDTDNERLDVFNGLLLAPHYDALFDAGWITFDEAGLVVISPSLKEGSRRVIGLRGDERLHTLAPEHARYLAWHRTHEFRR